MRRQYCTFAVGDLLVGIDVERVREILFDPDLTPVPMAHPAILGLLNLRGEIVTVLDARHRLGLPAGETTGDRSHVIVTADGETVSLLVDGEREVVEVDPRTALPPPETIAPEVRRLLSEIYELDTGELLVTLDAGLGLTTLTT